MIGRWIFLQVYGTITEIKIYVNDETIIPFAASGESGMGRTNEKLQQSCRGARLLEGRGFKRGIGKAELSAWVDSLKLSI